MVQVEMGLVRGDIEEIGSDSDDSSPKVVLPSFKEMKDTCQLLEENSLALCPEGVLKVAQVLHQYQGCLQRMSRELKALNRPLLIYSLIPS